MTAFEIYVFAISISIIIIALIGSIGSKFKGEEAFISGAGFGVVYAAILVMLLFYIARHLNLVIMR